MLGRGFSRAQSETMARLRAACCTKPSSEEGVPQAIAASVRLGTDRAAAEEADDQPRWRERFVEAVPGLRVRQAGGGIDLVRF
jgi:hypothetical protein